MTTEPRRRGWMLVAGVLVLIAGLVTAGALWYASGERLEDNVAGFARAPSGCATTLDFDRTGEFVLHLETVGTLVDLAGDCDAATDFDRDDAVDPQLELVDPDGAAVSIEPSSDGSYEAAGFVGREIATVVIETPGDHVLAVAADGAQFAIAIGHGARDGVTALRVTAIATVIVALLVGGLLLVLGSRQPPAPPESAIPWEPDDRSPSTWPVGPPGFPPPPPTTGAAGPAGPPLIEPPPAPTQPPAPAPWGPPSMGQ